MMVAHGCGAVHELFHFHSSLSSKMRDMPWLGLGRQVAFQHRRQPGRRETTTESVIDSSGRRRRRDRMQAGRGANEHE